MASIHEVARRAKVSVGTVSRVLNGSTQVTALTRRRVQRVISELGYQPNPSARALRSHRTYLIALALPELTNPYFAAIADGVQSVLEQAKFRLVLCGPRSNNDAEPEYIDMLMNRHVDGLIAAPRRFSATSKNLKTLIELGRKGYPLVWLGNRTDSEPFYFDSITTDTSNGMREAMSHLVQMGHREIAYFGAPKGIATGRLQMYRTVLQEQGIPVSNSLIFRINPTLENGFSLAKRLLQKRRRPTAIMAVNDIVAIGAMMALHEHGVSIPEEMSIVGFDDVPFASIVTPKLSTVFQPKYELGCLAAERLLERIEERVTNFQTILLSSHLVLRNSTAPPSLERRVSFVPATVKKSDIRGAVDSTKGERCVRANHAIASSE